MGQPAIGTPVKNTWATKNKSPDSEWLGEAGAMSYSCGGDKPTVKVTPARAGAAVPQQTAMSWAK